MSNLPENQRERAILIGIKDAQSDFKWIEFSELLKAAGALEVGRVVQNKDKPDPALFLGSGKVEELAALIEVAGADLVVAIQELSPVQIRNIENITKVRVIDRTALILDIFAQRALSKEGKLQVELAQLNYILPRLGSTDRDYSRLGGGIGTRGPGESKLEADRRRIRRRLVELHRELDAVAKNRMTQRKQRDKNEIPTIALVGYTNVGKSTLFNRLTAAGVSSQNRLFDTLDPVARQYILPDNRKVVFLDTVGFVSDLPHQLVAAFKATLEETARSTILLHVMDAGNPEVMQQFASVNLVLNELGVKPAAVINVLNKVDLIDSTHAVTRLANEWSGVPLSAGTGEGIDELLSTISCRLKHGVQRYELLISYQQPWQLDLIHRTGRVIAAEYTAEGIKVTAELEPALAARIGAESIGPPVTEE
jgi:GTP-binding protein HflX